jgi:hypothetical protein
VINEGDILLLDLSSLQVEIVIKRYKSPDINHITAEFIKVDKTCDLCSMNFLILHGIRKTVTTVGGMYYSTYLQK